MKLMIRAARMGLALGICTAVLMGSAYAGCVIEAREGNVGCQDDCGVTMEDCREHAYNQGQTCVDECPPGDEACVFECKSVYQGELDACGTTGRNCMQNCQDSANYEEQRCRAGYQRAMSECQADFGDCQADQGVACQAQYNKCVYEAQAEYLE